MRRSQIFSQEQYRLIMECRKICLTDYPWCVEHGIKPETFYNWVKRLCQKGCTGSGKADSSFIKYKKNVLCQSAMPIKTFSERFDFVQPEGKKTKRLTENILITSAKSSYMSASKLLAANSIHASKSSICGLLKKCQPLWISPLVLVYKCRHEKLNNL